MSLVKLKVRIVMTSLPPILTLCQFCKSFFFFTINIYNLEGVSCIAQPEIRWLPEFQQVKGRKQKNIFDGDETKYELWEVKFRRYLRI